MATEKNILQIRSMTDYQLAPNEPIGRGSINRIIEHLLGNDDRIKATIYEFGQNHNIQLWVQTAAYLKGDIVIYIVKNEKETYTAYMLLALMDKPKMPEYVIDNGMADFSASGWKLIHENMFYLHNDELLSSEIITPAINEAIFSHEIDDENGHHLTVIDTIDEFSKVFLKNDLSNFTSQRNVNADGTVTNTFHNSSFNETIEGGNTYIKSSSNNVIEMDIEFSFESRANSDVVVHNPRYFYEQKAVRDKSDDCIFSSYYLEDTISVELQNGLEYTNLRTPGTNIFTKEIVFPKAFSNTEYMIFQSEYVPKQFVFAPSISELVHRKEGTDDCPVGRIMFTNKTPNSVLAILPIHVYFSDYGKYALGVPWINKFKIHLVGYKS